MKKQIIVTASVLTIALCSGCGNTTNSQALANADVLKEQPKDTAPEAENPPADRLSADTGETALSFEDLTGRVFYFSSGAGAWCTELFINSDGTFHGNYHDTDMGDSGEGYPNGTLYNCAFTGTFHNLVKANEFTYKMELSSLDFKEKQGKEEIIDGVRYIYSSAYGLDDGKEFYIYLPGTKLSDLPQDYLTWVGYYYEMEDNKDTTLPFYGLYNVNTKQGFSSYEDEFADESLSERIAREISYAEDIAADLEAGLQRETTQSGMNETSKELFQTWDDTLNLIWNLLKNELDERTMETLRTEERDWIASKEAAVKAAGQGCEGGSIQPMVEWQKAAELTKERVYELAGYAE